MKRTQSNTTQIVSKNKRKLTDAEGLKLIQNLPVSSPHSIHEALQIYAQTPTALTVNKNAPLLNALLRCSLSAHADVIGTIWNDIEQCIATRHPQQRKRMLSFSDLLKCVIHGGNTDHRQCLQALQWMRACDKTLSIHRGLVTKLITKCKHDRSTLQFIHQLIQQQFIQNIDDVIHAALITAFGVNCHDLGSAQHVFDSHSQHVHIFSMNSMMTVYSHHQQYAQVLRVYDTCMYSQIQATEATHNVAIQACLALHDLEGAKRIDQQYIGPYLDTCTQSDGDTNVRLKTALIAFYGTCGDMPRAQHMFASIAHAQKDSVVIGALMTALIQNELPSQALSVYDAHTALQNGVIHMLAIKACAQTADLPKCKSIHAALTRRNQMQNQNMDVATQNTLILAYGKHGELEAAVEMYDEIPHAMKDAASIGAMMQSFIYNARFEEALALYEQQQTANNILHLLAIKACTHLRDLSRGQKIHRRIEQQMQTQQTNGVNAEGEHNKHSIELKNALLDFYGTVSSSTSSSSSSSLHESESMFEAMLRDDEYDIVSVNSMMKLYAQQRDYAKVAHLYRQHVHRSDKVSHLMALKAMHAPSMATMESGDISVRNALINFYGDLQDLEHAKQIFASIAHAEKDVVTIGSMMNAYVSNECIDECLQLFHAMETGQEYGHIVPNSTSVGIALRACTKGQRIQHGCAIHERLRQDKSELLQCLDVQTNLMNMYGQFGMMSHCQAIFDAIRNNAEDAITAWNYMIGAYGKHADIVNVKRLWHELKHNQPHLTLTDKTFVFLMNAYSHCGDVASLLQTWQVEMPASLTYNEYVRTSLVDGLCRNNYVYAAHELLIDYWRHTKHAYAPMWMALLHGCQRYENPLLAARVFRDMTTLFPAHDQHMIVAQQLMHNHTAVHNAAYDPHRYNVYDARDDANDLRKSTRAAPHQRMQYRRRSSPQPHQQQQQRDIESPIRIDKQSISSSDRTLVARVHSCRDAPQVVRLVREHATRIQHASVIGKAMTKCKQWKQWHCVHEIFDIALSSGIALERIQWNTFLDCMALSDAPQICDNYVQIMLDRYGLTPDAITISCLLKSCRFQAKYRFRMAMRFWRLIGTFHVNADRDVYNEMIIVCCKAKKIEQARVVLDAYLEKMEHRLSTHDLTLFNSYLYGIALNGDVDGMQQIMRTLHTYQLHPDRITVTNSLLCLNEAKRCQQALDTLRAYVADGGELDDTMRQIQCRSLQQMIMTDDALTLRDKEAMYEELKSIVHDAEYVHTPMAMRVHSQFMAAICLYRSIDPQKAVCVFEEITKHNKWIKYSVQNDNGQLCVDLHQFTKHGAQFILRYVIAFELKSFLSSDDAHEHSMHMTIIVGKGKHTGHKMGVLREFVMQDLLCYDPPIRSRIDETNEGCLVVEKKELLSYLSDAENARNYAKHTLTNPCDFHWFSGV